MYVETLFQSVTIGISFSPGLSPWANMMPPFQGEKIERNSSLRRTQGIRPNMTLL